MGQTKPNFKTPYSVVKGLGSTHHGTGHWILQRVSAVALVFLGLWLLYAFLFKVPAAYGDVVTWVQHPLHMVLLALTVGAMILHGLLGLQVVIEDYVHSICWRMFLIYGLFGLGFAAWALTIVCFIKIQSIHLIS